jgi:hypothetical protein
MLVSGCATDPSSFGALRPIYRAQGNLQGTSAQPFYEAGKRYFAEKRYGLALEAFQSELGRNGKSVKALNGIAACYDKLQRYDLAVNYYYKALGVDPESTRTLSNLGYSFLLQRRDADAKRVLSLALNKDPGNVFIKRNLALATSHVQELANTAGPSPQEDEIRQASSATEQLAPAETTLAVDAKSTEESSATAAGNNRSESATSGMIVRAADSEMPVSEVVQKVKAAPLQTVAEVAVADSGLLPAIEITSQVEQPAEPVPAQVAEVSPQVSTEVLASEPASVAEFAAADSGLLPAIEITSEVEQLAEEAPEPAQVAEVSPQVNVEVVASDPASVTEVAVADSGLLPAIEITSQVEQLAEEVPEPSRVAEVSPQVNVEVVASKPASVAEVAVADSGLLPAIDIISEVTEQPYQAKETSAQNVPGIATIDVDVALAESNVVKLVDTEMVPATGSGKQQGVIQNEQSKSPVTVHGSAEYTIEVSNGNGWNGMARLLGKHLKSKGEHVVRLTNADTFNYKDTVIYYSSGKRGVAERVAGKFPVQVRLQETKWNRQDIDVRVLIGEDVVFHAPVVRRSLYAWDNNGVSKSVAATVEVSNGNGRNGMARLLRNVLVNRGDSIRRVTNAEHFDHEKTVIYFSKGRHKDAQQLAAKLPVQATLQETSNNRKDIDLKVVIGKDFLNYEVAMRRIMDANA